MIKFNCVYAPHALTIRRFLKTVKCDEIVNYMEIINKLTKNDIYAQEPSDMVVNSYILKYIEKSIIKTKNETFFYVMSSLDEDVINNLQFHIINIAKEIDEKAEFYVHIKDKDTYQSIHHLFTEVYEITEIKK